MVQDFRTESLPVNFLQKAAFIFLSRIVLRRFTHDQNLEFRKLEATTKKKIRFLNFSSSPQSLSRL